VSTVCVHGLGYVGLPTAAMLANYDHEVSGYDVDDDLRAALRGGDVHLEEPGLRAFVTQALESDHLEITDDVVPAKYQMICVPTPFDESTKSADLDYVREAGRALTPHLRPGDTVVLESTVPPGTTVEELAPILERSGLAAGEDFALVHCPETVLPGNIITELRENDRVVAGVNGVSAESAVRLYESFVSGEIRTATDPTVAEFVKLVQNTYRDVNVALANEIARLAADYGIDSREAIDLANGHPRVDILQPGPGVGGHCLPVDPWFLGADSDELDLIATAREVNDGMAGFVIDVLDSALGGLDGATVAVMGAAYKGNVSDTRMSPGLRLARRLGEQASTEVAVDGGVAPEVRVHDPHVPDLDPDLDTADLGPALDGADAAVFATDHDEYAALDPGRVAALLDGDVVVDTRGFLDAGAWRDAGLTVRRV
jgi:UDP-N-acetyl-D-mannosaminuronic acid dehydrogenase